MKSEHGKNKTYSPNICYYKILGVGINASQEQIKRAFRKLALRYHPDVNNNREEACQRFRILREAYENLSDPIRRQRYDDACGYRKQNGWSGFVRQHVFFGNEEIWHQSAATVFEEVFDFRVEKSPSIQNNDLRFDLLLPREWVRDGRLEQIIYERIIYCPNCIGNGRTEIRDSCRRCHGDGTVFDKQTVNIWIPPGSPSGTRFRLSGAGDQSSPTRVAGDLIVVLHLSDGKQNL